MHLSEYIQFDGLALAGLVAKKKLTPLELVDAAIARAEALEPKLNAIVFRDFDRARDAAKGKVPKGPFTGVPMLLKDMRAAAAGMPTRSGSRMVPAVPAQSDSTLVARYRAGGLIPLGKTNVPEFGILPTTEPVLYGAARNPWNLDYSTGGSSGGSAAAVAAGIVPIAHATDGGGSIRIPASCCGLVGLKVSRGRITQGPGATDAGSGLSVDHVVTRSVRDCAAALDISCAYDYGDPYFAPPPEGSYLKGIGRKPKRLRIGFSPIGANGKPFAPDVEAALKKTVKLCESLGHRVEEVSKMLDTDQITLSFLTLWATNVALGVETLVRTLGRPATLDVVEGITLGLYERGKAIPAIAYMHAQQTLYMAARKAATFHETYDLWLTPTLSTPPVKLGTIDVNETDVKKAFDPLIGYVPFTAIQNGTGQPAINLPLYWSKNGLPIGVQFVARTGGEMLLLRFAAELERAQPWAERRPNFEG